MIIRIEIIDKFSSLKLESLVIAHQHGAVNTFPGLVHTARHTIRVECARSLPPTREDDPDRKGATDSRGVGYESLNRVNIAGIIGTHDDYEAHYGGEVYGASRGDATLGTNYSNAVWTEVNLKKGAHVQGNVFGGGDSGPVKQDSEVNVGMTFGITVPENMSTPISSAGGSNNSKTITVTSNANWEVNSNANWLTVSPVSGKGDGTITVTATANTGTGAVARTATITISGAGETQRITVTQEGNQ